MNLHENRRRVPTVDGIAVDKSGFLGKQLRWTFTKHGDCRLGIHPPMIASSESGDRGNTIGRFDSYALVI